MQRLIIIGGKELTDLCNGSNLRILNGRTVGDLFGNFKYYKGIGKSAIDYIITGKQSLENIAHCQVSEPIMFVRFRNL